MPEPTDDLWRPVFRKQGFYQISRLGLWSGSEVNPAEIEVKSLEFGLNWQSRKCHGQLSLGIGMMKIEWVTYILNDVRVGMCLMYKLKFPLFCKKCFPRTKATLKKCTCLPASPNRPLKKNVLYII